MAFHVRHPVWISAAPAKAAWAFALLFLLESIARASVATVIPIHAYDLFRTKENVSWLYTSVSLVALALSFAIPFMIRGLSRRWSYTVGAFSIAACGLLLATDSPFGQGLGMLARTFGAATLNITLNLYIMDYIAKTELVRSEPLRYAVSTVAWMLAPLAGVWLYTAYGVWTAAILPVSGSLALLATFWYLRLSEKGPIRPAKSLPPNPFAFIGRFAAQPRLRLAWFIAFARSAFWVTFFIYVPILMVEGKMGALAGGWAIAAGNAMLLNNLLVTGWARRYSLRMMIAVAFAGGAVFTAITGMAGTARPVLAGAMMVGASFFVSMLDGLGPIPFLRAVHVHERPQMTTVYRTYLDASELLPPFFYVFAFMLFGFSGAFWVLSALLVVSAAMAWAWLPKRM